MNKKQLSVTLFSIICSVILLEFTSFLSYFPLSDDSYYHGAAALAVSIERRLDESIYAYYNYPITFILGNVIHELSSVDMLIIAKMYSLFVSMYVALNGFLIGKYIFNDLSSAALCSLLSSVGSYYFPRWFSPFSISAILTVTIFYCLILLYMKVETRWFVATVILVATCILTHLGNSFFVMIFLLTLTLLLIFLGRKTDKYENLRSNAKRSQTVTFLFISFLSLFLAWNLYVNKFQMAQFIQGTIKTIMNPPIEEVYYQFTAVYFTKTDLFSIIKRMYILSIPIGGSFGAFIWFIGHYRLLRSKTTILTILFIAQLIFVILNVLDYLVRFGFPLGEGIAARTRWLLYLMSSWWLAYLFTDVHKILGKTLRFAERIFWPLLLIFLIVSGISVFTIVLADDSLKIVHYADFHFNLFLSHFINLDSNLYGYMTQQNIFFYHLISSKNIVQLNMVTSRLISMYEAVYPYKGGYLSRLLDMMNILVTMNLNRTKSFYSSSIGEETVEKIFSPFTPEKTSIVFNNGDHSVFIKEGY
ncbi:MAG: hypothetical protein QW482_03390 [Thermoproteota archaeon]